MVQIFEIPKKRLYPAPFLNGFKNGAGYTAIEMAVIAAIMVTITTIVLVGFGGYNDAVAVNRSARELGVFLRRAQNMALAVAGIPAIGNEVPPAVGIQLTKNSTSYILFGDRIASRDYKWNSGETIQSLFFDRGVRPVSFKNDIGVEITETTVLHIVFSAPEADPQIRGIDGAAFANNSKVDIILESPTGKRKTVTVRESGQISVQ